jgi:hypothetical protein
VYLRLRIDGSAAYRLKSGRQYVGVVDPEGGGLG